jgi:MFS transporter, FSR family, fosmidomycin resistance protein
MTAAPLQDARRDAETMGLIGLAHGTSHFHHMLLPPMFPVFIRDFGLTYAELGLLMTLFFTLSGVGQALSGFLVDKVGARPVLFSALGLFVAACVAAGTAQGYQGLMLAAALAGLGNAPFHPVDFTILNHRISPARLGHAFSVHGISGNLGWALSPVFLIGLHSLVGDWRWAYAAAAAFGLLVMGILWWRRDAIDDRVHAPPVGVAAAASTLRAEHPLAFLALPSVWLCFSFFFWTTAALSAIQSFASPALQSLYGLPLSITAFVVTGYMVLGALGMVAGGFLVNRVRRLERTIAGAMALSVALLLLVGSGWLSGWAAALVTALAGIGTGLAGPSRDMLIKRAAPAGATGRVYGTVYSGLDLGFAVAAPLFGWLLDHGWHAGMFQGAAAAMALGIASASVVGWRIHRQTGPALQPT